jgi:hypothetical protein
VGLAFALLEMPYVAAAFARGDVSEWRATITGRETACLTRADRHEVDRRLGSRQGDLAGLGDQELAAEARRIAYALDSEGFTRRAAKAKKDRRITLRPAPDTMTYLSGLLAVREGVAVYAALTKHADSLRARGYDRSRGQIMADTLVERVTGVAVAPRVPLAVGIVISDAAVFGEPGTPSRDTPAHVDGYGLVPAPVAREWLADPDTEVWVRRLYSRAGDHALVAMDSARRGFAANLRRFIKIRDQRCRTPRGVTRRSGTWITPCATPTAARPASRTRKASARPATTPRKHPTGAAARATTVRAHHYPDRTPLPKPCASPTRPPGPAGTPLPHRALLPQPGAHRLSEQRR